jgi:hypothetical protein
MFTWHHVLRRALPVVGLLAATIVLIPGATPAGATTTTLFVTSTGSGSACTEVSPCGSVQTAVTTAASDAADVTIDVGAGTFTEESGVTLPSGDETSLTITGAGASSTTVQPGGADTVFKDFGQSYPVTLEGLTISGGAAVQGAGIAFETTGALTLSDDTITDNVATDLAGGVMFESDALLTMTDDTISDDNGGGSGGGLWVSSPGTAILDGDTFSNDTSDNGGGIDNDEATVTMNDDTLTADTADNGGALAAENEGASFIMSNSTIVDNSASVGGALITDSNGVSTFTNDTFGDNAAGGSGEGGGIFIESGATTAGVVVANSLFAQNTPGSNCSTAVTDGGYNVADDATCGFGDTSIQNSTTIGTLTLAANGSTGPQTTAITTASSAFGEVPQAACTLTTDERGLPRPGTGYAACDAGAFEVQGSVTAAVNPNGYRLAAGDGGVFDYGVQYGGSLAGLHLNAPIVGLANESGPDGYLLVGSDGGVYALGGAQFYGSLGSQTVASPIVGIATTPDDGGYWLVSRSGTTYNFGDAPALGPISGLNAPIVGIATDASGMGAWLVGSDGGVFALGNAVFEGSLGAVHLNAPIVGIAPSPAGSGYVLAAADGGAFAFPSGLFHGSAANVHLAAPIVGIAETNSGSGYWLVGADGGVFNYGDAPYLGSMGGTRLNAPMVGIQHLGA